MSREQDSVACLVFRVAGQSFAVSGQRLVEVTEPLAVTPVPDAPDFLEGIVSLRGRAVPLVDLRRRWGVPAGEGRAGPVRAKYLVMHADGHVVAMRVDAVDGMARLTRKDLYALPPSLPKPAAVLGLARWQDRWLILLDPRQLLSAEEGAALDELLKGISDFEESGRDG